VRYRKRRERGGREEERKNGRAGKERLKRL